jgi:hypothetical protein
VLLQLERRGIRARADPRAAREVGVHRVAEVGESVAQLYVVAGDDAIARVSALPGARRLAEVGVRVADSDRQSLVTELHRQGVEADDRQVEALLRSFSRDAGAMVLFGVAPRR